MGLCLTRRPGEGVVLTLPDGSTVRVVVLSYGGGRAKLLFEAPGDVKIFRDELYQPQDCGRRHGTPDGH